MQVIHILLLFLNLLVVEGFEIFITTPVKIIDCSAERDEGLLTVETTTHTHGYEAVPVDPKEFYEAVRDGNISYIANELAQGNNNKNNSRLSKLLTWRNEDHDNYTALHAAAAEGQTPVILALLETGVSPNVKDRYGATPVHRAAGGGHIEALSVLLKPQYQVHVNQQTDDGETPIFYALRAWALNRYINRTAIVEVLVAHGANVNKASNTGTSPLIMASAMGRLGAAQVLIDAGARLNKANDEGSTALHRAAVTAGGNRDMVYLLLKNGADKYRRDKKGRTAARVASNKRHLNIMRIIDNWQ